VGGVSTFTPILRHRCKQPTQSLTYSDLGGWNCNTVSSSPQNKFFTWFIISHDGVRSLSIDTDTCYHPNPSDAIQNTSYPLNLKRNAPLFPALKLVANSPVMILYCSGT
jgi:hypothetical protein